MILFIVLALGAILAAVLFGLRFVLGIAAFVGVLALGSWIFGVSPGLWEIVWVGLAGGVAGAIQGTE